MGQFLFMYEEGNNPPATTMNRLIALLALVVCAFAEPEAEANPWYTYGYGGLYRPYTYGATQYPRTYGYGNRFFYKRALRLREPEGEPEEAQEVEGVAQIIAQKRNTKKKAQKREAEADPWYTFGYSGLYRPYTYGAHMYPRTYSYGNRFLYKREAEADPQGEGEPEGEPEVEADVWLKSEPEPEGEY